MSKHKKVTIKVPKFNYWSVLTLVFLVLFVASFFGKLNYNLNTVSANSIGEKAINYINNNLVRPGTSASLVGVKDLGSVYEVDTRYQGRNIPVYVTKDGKMMFLSAFKLSNTGSENNKPSSNPQPENIPKSKVPDVKLFVMSYCPFGLQAEKAMLPVMKLLGNKANITIHFVYYSMHGPKEVYENLRQYCIQKDQRSKYYNYLLCFVQSGNYSKCLKEANIDIPELLRCMNETDKKYNITKDLNDKSTWISGRFPPFSVDLSLNRKYGVQGSPTLVINGKVVSLTRSPESFKEAICSAFINPPKECNISLSSTPTAPGIGPINSTSSTSSGSCS